MSEQQGQETKRSQKKDSVSIIYHQKNDSPKYFEIKKSKIYLFFIGLPAITLISLVLGFVGLLNTSPIKLIQSYDENHKVRAIVSDRKELENKLENQIEENSELKSQLQTLEEQLKSSPPAVGDAKCPAPPICPSTSSGVSSSVQSTGLSTLSLFKRVQGQKDRSRPATLDLSGFKAVTTRDTVNLQFNIIPATDGDTKISGHIIVLMKNEASISAYPLQALSGNDFQINYSNGETFATQRFRPVDASFPKPRKSGNYSFTVFIFSRNGDLLHYQTVNLPVKL